MELSTNFVEKMLPYERDAFLWLNQHHSDFWDVFMMTYSGKILWVPLCIVIIISLFYKTKWTHAVLFLLCFVVLATLCDQLSASVIKPFFSRLRPSHHPDFRDYVQIVNDYRGGRLGFVSAHAANGFGAAVFISLVFRYRLLTVTVFLWALINSYTRIYLGVHFISDIIGGMILGSILGGLIYLLYQYGRVKFLKQTSVEISQSIYTPKHGRIIITAIMALVLFNIFYSLFSIYCPK